MTIDNGEVTKKLAEFIANEDEAKIPDHIYQHAICALIDYFAVTIEGAEEPLVKKLLDYADEMGGNPQATIIGYKGLRSVSQAALINGSSSHALDYDDTLANFFGHPSVTIFPALLALSEWKGLSGRALLTAYIIGLQAGTFVGSSAGLMHYMGGWHATATIGHFASVAACARLLKLNVLQTQYALGIAGTRAAGLKRVFGTMCKPYHAGLASEAGMMSALLASKGFDSAPDILEGEFGFFKCMKGTVNKSMLVEMDKYWEIVGLSQKYHASCHATHSPVEAALTIVEEGKIALYDIKLIRVGVSQLALDAAGKDCPEQGIQGKFSIKYCVANALVSGVTDASAFTNEAINHTETKKLMDKIVVELDSKVAGLAASVKFEMQNGQVISNTYDILKKIPPLDVKKQKVINKYKGICVYKLGEVRSEMLERDLLNFDKLENVRSFFLTNTFFC